MARWFGSRHNPGSDRTRFSQKYWRPKNTRQAHKSDVHQTSQQQNWNSRVRRRRARRGGGVAKCNGDAKSRLHGYTTLHKTANKSCRIELSVSSPSSFYRWHQPTQRKPPAHSQYECSLFDLHTCSQSNFPMTSLRFPLGSSSAMCIDTSSHMGRKASLRRTNKQDNSSKPRTVCIHIRLSTHDRAGQNAT